ncbi:hypothetical protein [Bacillus thermotolerans]|uniref:Uncharacterized protein n=1 Tax=Bacillus thermotolerans TaxID=1221996 RepID=A0A0F5IDC1_BACTR|nr:hypothetical protein [Bacillus thermotolerans]KKB33987.1 hypothetical protein QY96_00284 [Bacillus thermotolerans]KKB34805.1 hypothetical protein QY97_02113 [Bacillus thermotolerans]KKB43345.1 hypothetical protein QY95_01590 [Bacillus thermotolerans]
MLNMLHGLKDIHTVVSNKRKVGGVAEADSIQLSSGEVYQYPVFTNIDLSKGQYVSLSFIDEKGQNIMTHVNQIAVIKGLAHKLICQMDNIYVQRMLLSESIQYLQKLCEVNEGFVTHTFKKEALQIVRDISVKELKRCGVTLPFQVEEKLVHLSDRMHA